MMVPSPERTSRPLALRPARVWQIEAPLRRCPMSFGAAPGADRHAKPLIPHQMAVSSGDADRQPGAQAEVDSLGA